MKTRLTMLLTALLVMSTALNAQDVTYNFDQAADFAKYKTYKWVDIKGAVHPDQIVDKQIRSTIDSQLAAKGLSKTDGDKAELYISYQIAVSQEKQIDSYNMGGAGWGYGPRWGGGMQTATTSTINIGTLILDMYDPGTKQLVWRGRASKTIDANAKPDKRQKNLEKGMAKLLKNYPPKKK